MAEATTVEEALESVREPHPDLVVLDMNMAGMGGLEACRAIRRDSNIAIIMLTVRNSEADKVAALDAGADDFVTNPFSTGTDGADTGGPQKGAERAVIPSQDSRG